MFAKQPTNINEYINIHKNHVNYCESIILPNGDICDCIPSHIETLIRISNETKESINKQMPNIAAPLYWLICHTNCVGVWFDFLLFHNMTIKQKETLKKLYETNIISKYITCIWTNEKEHCIKLENYKPGDILSENSKEISIHDIIL